MHVGGTRPLDRSPRRDGRRQPQQQLTMSKRLSRISASRPALFSLLIDASLWRAVATLTGLLTTSPSLLSTSFRMLLESVALTISRLTYPVVGAFLSSLFPVPSTFAISSSAVGTVGVADELATIALTRTSLAIGRKATGVMVNPHAATHIIVGIIISSTG